MIGLITSAAGLLGQAYNTYQTNKNISALMKKIQAPSDKPVQLAEGQLAKAQSMEQGQMPGTEAYENQIRQNQASQIAAAERGGGDTIANAALAAGQANQAQLGLAQQQGQFKLGAAGQTAQAAQGYGNAIMQNEQLKNDYIQSLISGKSTMAQNWQNLGQGALSLGGALMGNAAYLGAKQPNKTVNFWDWGYKP